MRRTGLTWGCLAILAGMTTGCSMAVGGSMAPPPPRPAYYGPTTSYAPGAPQAMGGPVAFAPAPILASAPTIGTLGPSGSTYQHARSDDTLTTIASRYNVSVEDLRKVNPNIKHGDTVAPGQLVRIPDGNTAIR
ncbi:LysM peptidoglycan-binding domain-containing protein [bacterium]|nr:LysM peptidoglycan-binding domain-containing protein [bacterium]